MCIVEPTNITIILFYLVLQSNEDGIKKLVLN